MGVSSLKVCSLSGLSWISYLEDFILTAFMKGLVWRKQSTQLLSLLSCGWDGILLCVFLSLLKANHFSLRIPMVWVSGIYSNHDPSGALPDSIVSLLNKLCPQTWPQNWVICL
jgi:hypothetical protein